MLQTFPIPGRRNSCTRTTRRLPLYPLTIQTSVSTTSTTSVTLASGRESGSARENSGKILGVFTGNATPTRSKTGVYITNPLKSSNGLYVSNHIRSLLPCPSRMYSSRSSAPRLAKRILSNAAICREPRCSLYDVRLVPVWLRDSIVT